MYDKLVKLLRAHAEDHCPLDAAPEAAEGGTT